MPFEDWRRDLTYGIRTLGRERGFAAVAVTTLALGIGANTTVFSLANAVLFKNLPFEDSERVLYLRSGDPSRGNELDRVSYPDFKDLREAVTSFQSLECSNHFRVNLSDDRNMPETHFLSSITANGLAAVGQRPILGRGFQPEDERPGAAPVAILTEALWQRRFGGDPGVVGRQIRVDALPATVIGVMPKGFSFPTDTDFWMPFIPTGSERRQDRYLTVYGKLRDGVSRAAAQAEISTVAQRLAAAHPETDKGIQIRVGSFQEMELQGPIHLVFLALLGAVGFVLLIACANVANLMLARSAGRAREISIRAALGAGRWSVVRQLLAESLLLSASGGLIGWMLSLWGIRAFDAATVDTGRPVWIDFSMDYRAFAYLAAITLGTALLFGLVPALRLAKVDMNSALKDGGRGAGGGLRGSRIAGALVAGEMALAVVLLTGAGLMIRSFLKAYSQPMGVRNSGVITMVVELPDRKYDTPERRLAFQKTLEERLRALPAVENAAVASTFFNGGPNTPYEIEGAPADPGKRPFASGIQVSEGYFETLGVAALRGRLFTAADHAGGPVPVVVNRAFAVKNWPNEEAVGKRVRLFKGDAPGEWLSIVGVIPDILPNVHRDQVAPAVYGPFRQSPQGWMAVMARTRVAPASLGQSLQAAVRGIDRDLPARQILTLDERIALNRWQWRVFGSMFAIFAAIALLLAVVGLYAVAANGVSRRTREIGVRVALGASSGRVLAMVLSQGARQAGIGMALGLALAFAATRVLGTLLLGVKATDPLTFVLTVLVLGAAAIAGCLAPARRAATVDPSVALRHE